MRLGRVLDWLTPPPMRVSYGYDSGAGSIRPGCEFSWECWRCARRARRREHVRSADFTRSLADAEAGAREHARGRHFGMRAVRCDDKPREA